MKRLAIYLIALILFLQSGCQKQGEPEWFLKATYHEGCSCNAPCPCPFGLPMTNSYCKMNALIDIHDGRYDKIDLSGIQVVMSGSIGSWAEYYFPETISDQQQKALEDLLKIINGFGTDNILKSEKTKVAFNKKDGKVFFSVPGIRVELDMVKGANNQPVVVENLSNKLFKGYIPHLSIVNERVCADTSRNFSLAQKAGFTSDWDLSDKDYE